MMIALVGARTASCSAVSMPSMPGMLMSSRTTSTLLSPASVMASGPDDTLPATNMSGSNPSSFERWSRVSAMSSTMTTLMRSATSGVCRRDRSRRQDAVLVDELLQSDARCVDGLRAGVGRRAEHERHVAVELGKAHDLGLLRRDREQHDHVRRRRRWLRDVVGRIGWSRRDRGEDLYVLNDDLDRSVVD